MIYPYSNLVRSPEGIIRHAAGLVEAENKDEAHGLATRIAIRCYPQESGFFSHHTVIGNDFAIDPENCVATPVETG